MCLAVVVLSTSCVYHENVNTDANGVQIGSYANLRDVSADGRYVLFQIGADLDPADTNTTGDLYRKDTLTGALDLVTPGADANTLMGEISDDGRWVTFTSDATTLVPGDTNGITDAFLRDMDSNSIVRVNEPAGGQATSVAVAATISGDGRYVAFHTREAILPVDTNTSNDVYRYDRVTGMHRLVSGAGIGSSQHPSLSTNGSVVAFHSSSSDLVAGDTNGTDDVFAWFAFNGSIARVSVDASGGQASGTSRHPSISGNGLSIGFESDASDLTLGDINNRDDIFVKLITGDIFVASVDTAGNWGNGDSSGAQMNRDGSLVAFRSEATNLTGLPVGENGGLIRDGFEETTTVVMVDEDGSPIDVANLVLAVDAEYVAFGGSFDTVLRWWSEPEISTVSPSVLSLGQATSVTVSGSGFNRFATHLTYTNRAGNDGLTFSNVVVVDDETITADVVVSGSAAVGDRTVWVEGVGTGPGSNTGALVNCGACLAVVP